MPSDERIDMTQLNKPTFVRKSKQKKKAILEIYR